MANVDRWILRITLPVIALALAWQAWLRPSLPGDGQPAPLATQGDSTTARTPRVDPCAHSLAGRTVPPAPNTRFVPWTLLKSYQYQPALASLPTDLQALDGQRVTMAGFLLPLYEFEDIREFALVGNHLSCCFGEPPTLNGVVRVRLRAGEAGLPNTSEALRVVGTFRTREEKHSGYLVSIYEIEGGTASVL